MMGYRMLGIQNEARRQKKKTHIRQKHIQMRNGDAIVIHRPIFVPLAKPKLQHQGPRDHPDPCD